MVVKECIYRVKNLKKTNGQKPWLIINNILARAGLAHRIIGPDKNDDDSDDTLRLLEAISGVEIYANDLSTGEKVLMWADSNPKCNTREFSE